MLGPVMVDVEGLALSDEDVELLRHPAVGGVILFARNYQSPAQVRELVTAIHGVRNPALLVAVDQEGGRIQRFQEGFTRLPAARRAGERYDRDPAEGLALAEALGWMIGAELRAVGVDFSFAPVLDLDRGISDVIGDRAFHAQPETVAQLAEACIRGLQRAGTIAVGKHFPGHGGVAADSHLAIPVDTRPFDEIAQADLIPFQRLAGALAGVMPAHVVYSQAAPEAAGFSPFWLQEVLRGRLGFDGVVFSDDLNMEGARVAGGYLDSARAALAAGCDMVLVCNNRPAAVEVVEGLGGRSDGALSKRLERLHGAGPELELADLRAAESWYAAAEALA
ncbi:beta-N-acetylhexosaminidase [Ectothiorhodospiraceae bacterium 2226]|nr:beta-N-acetylhexosaminidase [Ectothiorhodospiraceae bacterium 2226]